MNELLEEGEGIDTFGLRCLYMAEVSDKRATDPLVVSLTKEYTITDASGIFLGSAEMDRQTLFNQLEGKIKQFHETHPKGRVLLVVPTLDQLADNVLNLNRIFNYFQLNPYISVLFANELNDTKFLDIRPWNVLPTELQMFYNSKHFLWLLAFAECNSANRSDSNKKLDRAFLSASDLKLNADMVIQLSQLFWESREPTDKAELVFSDLNEVLHQNYLMFLKKIKPASVQQLFLEEKAVSTHLQYVKHKLFFI